MAEGGYGVLQRYEELLTEYYKLMEGLRAHCVTKDVGAECFEWDSIEGQLLLKGDSAIELGGGSLPAVSGVLYCDGLASAGGRSTSVDAGSGSVLTDTGIGSVSAAAGGEAVRLEETSTETAVRRVALYGQDLPMLKGDVPYARVSLVGIKKEFTTEGYKLYNLIRSIEYIRYRVSPMGYMPRISTVQDREQVRVSRAALDEGLDFYKVGRLYEEAYLKHPAVQWAETVFITLRDFDYGALRKLFERAESVTMSLEHPLGNLQMDCNSCKLKTVCDEVEALPPCKK
ncbi:MAG: hypothetical protein NC092_06835 [Butyrivibrio sp.]|nr:hypothetical protein [Muribaculum sp.]MCM1552391.1 hypothetical protein [Butyrivibrio sp.]